MGRARSGVLFLAVLAKAAHPWSPSGRELFEIVESAAAGVR